MSVTDIVVVIASAAVMAGLGWFFFAPRRAVIAIWAAVIALFLLMLILHLTGAVGPGTMG